jgi:hypothetical protein
MKIDEVSTGNLRNKPFTFILNETVAGFCEHVTEHSVSIKGGKLCDWLGEYSFSKKPLLHELTLTSHSYSNITHIYTTRTLM